MKDKPPTLLLLMVGAILLLVAAFIFRDFLFGDALLLFKDAGSDSLNDYYPSFVHLSDYVRSHGFPSWSFSTGMGQDLSYLAGYLILEPVTWLPRTLIAQALVFQHLAKVLIAGLLFFHFLRLRGLHPAASLLGSLLISFSAYMCMGTCWYPLADEVVCFSGLLFATEIALKRGRWFVLVPVVALLGAVDAFHLYLGALFLLLYVPARLFGQYGWQPRILLRTSLLLAGSATLGASLSAIITLPNLYAILNSPRGSGASFAARLNAFPVFVLESRLHYITAALKPFANDILGTADAFRGWGNYLEAPLTYCGLLCLVIVPQVFVGARRRPQLVYGLFVASLLLTMIIPWLRYLFWLFQGDYYRALSLFSILGLITLSAIAFSRHIEGRPLNLWLLTVTTVVVVGALYLPVDEMRSLTDPALKRQAAIFLVCYAGLLGAGQWLRKTKITGWIIVALVAFELILFDRITVSNRSTVSKQELKERVGYNDETIEALRDIKASDGSSFYRVTKLRSSSPGVLPGLNDAMVFGYYGTSYYSSFNNRNYIDFLIAVEAIPPNSEIATRYSVGLLNDPILSLFAGEKYALTDNPIPLQQAVQYEFMKRYDRDYLFRNARFLSLGLAFDRYIPKDVFLKLFPGEKPEVLLRAVVLSDQIEGEKLGLSPIALSDLEQEIRSSSLAEVVGARRKVGLDLTGFQQTRIEGKVVLERKSVLVVQTPFDRGWHATQDGRPAVVLKADIGLLGVALDAGEHKLELSYRNPYLVTGMALSVGSLIILVAGVWRWPRFRLPA
ncbi:MAG: hypothetical protein QOK24_1982 [Verrucomicrobiota bacterium]|jgi:uncharacterized membrane protein YfhO